MLILGVDARAVRLLDVLAEMVDRGVEGFLAVGGDLLRIVPGRFRRLDRGLERLGAQLRPAPVELGMNTGNRRLVHRPRGVAGTLGIELLRHTRERIGRRQRFWLRLGIRRRRIGRCWFDGGRLDRVHLGRVTK